MTKGNKQTNKQSCQQTSQRQSRNIIKSKTYHCLFLTLAFFLSSLFSNKSRVYGDGVDGVNQYKKYVSCHGFLAKKHTFWQWFIYDASDNPTFLDVIYVSMFILEIV